MKLTDLRQKLADDMIREILAETDRDTIRRYRLGQRIIDTPTGPEWTYFVNAQGKAVDEHGNLLGTPD